MFRHSPNRGHRSKGFKVKDVLQICLLLAVCFWLIYQVKHSHDKKKEFDAATDAKISTKIFANSQSGIETAVNLGRKDIKPLVEERSIRDKKREEEEEVEETEVEEEIKHEEEEPEDKDEEKDDERREGGDNEMDELDQEKTEEEALREEESGEKEKDDEGDDEKEDQMENESSTEDDPEHDSSGSKTHNHEAREENYKGDDASSAVAHDGQKVSKGTEDSIFENENGNVEAAEESNTNKENDVDENDFKYKEGKGEMAGNDKSVIGITTEEKVIDTGLPKPVDSYLHNSIVSTESSVQPVVINSADAKMETVGSPLYHNFKQNQDRTVAQSFTTTGEDSGFRIVMREQNSNQSGASIENRPVANSISVINSVSEDLKSLTSEKIGSSDTQGSFKHITQSGKSDTTNQAVENTDPMLNKKAEEITEGAGEREKGFGFSSANDDGDAIQHDPIDSSDTLLTRQGEKSGHTDSGSLPQTKEGGRGEDAAHRMI